MGISQILLDKHLLKYRTVMIHNLPEHLSSDIALRNTFDSMYPNRIDGAMVVPYVPLLRSLQLERTKILKNLQESIDEFEKVSHQ